MYNKKLNPMKKKDELKKIQEEKKLLQVTLDYLAQENEDLRNQIEDMKMTVKTNKDQLYEYITTITNKDKVVDKMTKTIENLQMRLQVLEEQNRNKRGKSPRDKTTQDKTLYRISEGGNTIDNISRGDLKKSNLGISNNNEPVVSEIQMKNLKTSYDVILTY